MPITERTLRRWRGEALNLQRLDYSMYDGTAASLAGACKDSQERILKLTQELLDQHLLRKVMK
jgi:hypothetical protein